MKYDQLLLKVLEIIEYEGDKKDLLNRFNQFVMVKAIVSLFENLSEQEINDLQQQIDKNPINTPEELNKYFSKEQVEKVLKLEYGKLVNDLLQDTFSNAPDDKKSKILELMESINA